MAIDDASLDILNLPEEIVAISNKVRNVGVDSDEALKLLKDKETYYKYLKSKKWQDYMTGKIPVEGVKSVSASVVNGIIDADEELFELQKEINQLQRDYNVSKSYAQALDTKKRMIETSVKVAMAGWYSDVRVREWEEVDKYINSNGDILDPMEDRAKLRERRRRKAIEEEEQEIE